MYTLVPVLIPLTTTPEHRRPFTPSRLAVDGGYPKVGFLFKIGLDSVQVWEVVGSAGFKRGLEDQVLLQGHVTLDEAGFHVLLVFPHGLVCQLQVLPGFLSLFAWGGVRV